MKPIELDPDEHLEYEERAAIREYLGEQTREDAERGALRDLVEAATAAVRSPRR